METHSVLEPGTVLPPGRLVPAGQLWGGNPAKFMRELTKDEVSALRSARTACTLTLAPTSLDSLEISMDHLLSRMPRGPHNIVWPLTAFAFAVADS